MLKSEFMSQVVKAGTAALLAVSIVLTVGLPAFADNQVAISDEVNVIAEGDGEVVAIGGEVRVSGETRDELFVMGGKIGVDVKAEEEAIVIGGEIELRGTYAGELVSVGGVIDYYGANNEEVVFVGGEITVHEEAVSGAETVVIGGYVNLNGRFAGPATFGGGEVHAKGQFADSVDISAVTVVVSGEFYGDLSIEGENISIEEGTVITGNLVVRSPTEPDIAESIEFQPGTYSYEHIDKYDPSFGDVRFSEIIAIVSVISVILGALLLIPLLVPLIIMTASNRVANNSALAFWRKPLESFLIGLVSVPLIAIVGAFLTLALIGPYFIIGSYFMGIVVAAWALVSMVMRKVGDPVGGPQRFAFTLLGTLVLVVVASLHWTGCVIVGLAMVQGLGAFTLTIFNAAPSADADFDRGPALEAFDDEGRDHYRHDRADLIEDVDEDRGGEGNDLDDDQRR